MSEPALRVEHDASQRPDGPETLSLEQFERFRALVRAQAGIALRDEKRQLVFTRLSRRLRALGLSSFDEYYTLLQRKDPRGEELQRMLNAITTNKTSFFREEHHFDILVKEVLSPLAQKSTTPRLRIWSAGCSTGEEAYSILMTVCDALPSWQSSDIRVLASDIDTQVMDVGRRAVYPQQKLEEIPSDVAGRWIIEGTGDKRGLIRVRRQLRELVTFQQINFVADEWRLRAQFDAIFCRNALIYFDGPTQKQIVERLLAFLAPGGLLCLGHSESMAGARDDLKSLGRTAYRYVRRAP